MTAILRTEALHRPRFAGVSRGLFILFLVFATNGAPALGAEAPCGIDREAERILALAKAELGIYSAVVTPHVKKIVESGGLEVATADAVFDKLSSDAKKDGYDLRNIAGQLKAFNRLVLGCAEYPGYLKKQEAERERAAREKEMRRKAEEARLKQQEEEARLAKLENERLEREREAQRQIEIENQRRRLAEERAARAALEYQQKVDEKAASLSEGCVVQIPKKWGKNSLIRAEHHGLIGVVSKLTVSGDSFSLTLKSLRDLRQPENSVDPVDLFVKAVKKRKTYDVQLSKDDLLSIQRLAATERQYFGR